MMLGEMYRIELHYWPVVDEIEHEFNSISMRFNGTAVHCSCPCDGL